jgi:hypothetical protein
MTITSIVHVVDEGLSNILDFELAIRQQNSIYWDIKLFYLP